MPADERLHAARGERPRRDADHEVASDEGNEAEERTRHERQDRRRANRRTPPEPLRRPEDDQGREEEGRLASESGHGEERAGPEPAPRALVGTDERPEEKQRRRDRERVPQEQRLVEQEGTVEGGTEPGRDRGERPEEAIGEECDEPHVDQAENELAEANRPDTVAHHPPHAGEHVGVKWRLVEYGLAAPPALPGLERGDLLHPRGVLVHRIAAEKVARHDAPRPGPRGGHVAFGPAALILGHWQPRHHGEVREPHQERDREDEEQGASPHHAAAGTRALAGRERTDRRHMRGAGRGVPPSAACEVAHAPSAPIRVAELIRKTEVKP